MCIISIGEGNGNPLRYFCLGNPMYREAWGATVHGVAKSPAELSNGNSNISIDLFMCVVSVTRRGQVAGGLRTVDERERCQV